MNSILPCSADELGFRLPLTGFGDFAGGRPALAAAE